jgi:hypothetical protein
VRGLLLAAALLGACSGRGSAPDAGGVPADADFPRGCVALQCPRCDGDLRDTLLCSTGYACSSMIDCPLMQAGSCEIVPSTKTVDLLKLSCIDNACVYAVAAGSCPVNTTCDDCRNRALNESCAGQRLSGEYGFSDCEICCNVHYEGQSRKFSQCMASCRPG